MKVCMLCIYNFTHMQSLQDAPDAHGTAKERSKEGANTGRLESTAPLYNARLRFKGRRTLFQAWDFLLRPKTVGRRAADFEVDAVS